MINIHEYLQKYVRPKGMGDVVGSVTQPIARTIDKTSEIFFPKHKTNLANCGGCKKRKDGLNRRYPL